MQHHFEKCILATKYWYAFSRRKMSSRWRPLRRLTTPSCASCCRGGYGRLAAHSWRQETALGRKSVDRIEFGDQNTSNNNRVGGGRGLSTLRFGSIEGNLRKQNLSALTVFALALLKTSIADPNSTMLSVTRTVHARRVTHFFIIIIPKPLFIYVSMA